MKAINPLLFGQLLTGIIILIVVYFVLRRIGLIQPIFISGHEKKKKKKENEVAQEIAEGWKAEAEAPKKLDEHPGFNIEHYKKGDFSQLITPDSRVKEISEDLHSALSGWFGDDEEMIFSTLKNEVKNSYQLSQVSNMYNNLFQEDLLERFISDLDSRELLRILNIINNYEK